MEQSLEPTSAGYLESLTSSSPPASVQPALRREDARALAEKVYIFGYPLVLMEMTRRVMTSVPSPSEEVAPVNQFLHKSTFPDATFTEVVSPNADTLYSSAWLDLGREPLVLSLPEMGGRYFMVPMLDAWTNVFASPGSRTSGQHATKTVLVGPHWHGQPGDLPAQAGVIHSPTNMVWIIGRTYATGSSDYAAVHTIQKQYRLTPLSAWDVNYQPRVPVPVPDALEVDRQMAPSEQVSHMDAETFIAQLCALMSTNPPAPADAPMLENMARLGLLPGQAVAFARLDPTAAEALRRSASPALAKIAASASVVGDMTSEGWLIGSNLGKYGTDYLKRAVIAKFGLGANLPDDAIYPRATADSDGQPLSGQHRYVLHFAPDRLPPARGFWSLTMYNARQYFVANVLKRYNLGSRDPLRYNEDGSLDIYLQADSPDAANQANWLPSPRDRFAVILRLYWPQPEALTHTWRPPAIRRSA